MPGCLSVGMNAAKTLAAALNKPIVGVHHMVRYTCILVAYPLTTPLARPRPDPSFDIFEPSKVSISQLAGVRRPHTPPSGYFT